MTKHIGGGEVEGEEGGDPDGFVHTQINFYNRKELHFYSLLGLFFILSVNLIHYSWYK